MAYFYTNEPLQHCFIADRQSITDHSCKILSLNLFAYHFPSECLHSCPDLFPRWVCLTKPRCKRFPINLYVCMFLRDCYTQKAKESSARLLPSVARDPSARRLEPQPHTIFQSFPFTSVGQMVTGKAYQSLQHTHTAAGNYICMCVCVCGVWSISIWFERRVVAIPSAPPRCIPAAIDCPGLTCRCARTG